MRSLVAALVLCLFATPLQAKWWEAETAHFVIKSRDSKEATERFARDLERFDGVMRQLQGMPLDHEEPSRATKLTVYRFGQNRDIARVAGAPGSGIAGFFRPVAGDSVAFTSMKQSGRRDVKSRHRQDRRAMLDGVTVLKHEYTHYFMMQHFPGAYPRWYVEGFAEVMGTMRIEKDGSAHIGDPPQHRAFQIFQLNSFKLKDMLDANHKLSGLQAYQHYATGWLLTHYLSFDFDGPRAGQLQEFLTALANGEDSLTSAERIFGDLSQLEKELNKYKRGPFPGLKVNAPKGINHTVSMRQLSKFEQSLISQEMRISAGIDDEKEARDIASDIRAKIADQPNDVYALEMLASAQYSAEDYDQAISTADRMISVDSNSTTAWLVKAFAAIEGSKKDPALAEKAREYASMAANTNADDPRPLIAYYMSYLESDETIPETAVIALEQAFESAGSDTGYRLLLTRQLLAEDRLESARAVLLPVAFAGHRTGEPKDEDDPSLYRLLDLVLEEDRDGALTMIDEMIDDEEEEDA